ncbi:hypothetical protein NB713_001742 [Xanthomonas sacchari]|nr:hypothetical protein [Xanthomonas sacchari]
MPVLKALMRMSRKRFRQNRERSNHNDSCGSRRHDAEQTTPSLPLTHDSGTPHSFANASLL